MTATSSHSHAGLGGLDHSRMQRLLGYNLAQASIPAFGIFEHSIGTPLKLRQVDFTIMTLLASNKDVTQKNLSAALGIAPPNLTVIIDRLVKFGHVKRVRSDSDRRSQLLQLTASGKNIQQKAEAVSVAMETELLGHFSDGERVLLFELLQRVSRYRKLAKRAAELA